jgi:hypothetical protein
MMRGLLARSVSYNPLRFKGRAAELAGLMAKSTRPTKDLALARPVESLILVIRGQKVILDTDLAVLYQVATGTLNQAVGRNVDRFVQQAVQQVLQKQGKAARCAAKGQSGDWRSQADDCAFLLC